MLCRNQYRYRFPRYATIIECRYQLFSTHEMGSEWRGLTPQRQKRLLDGGFIIGFKTWIR